MEFKQINTRSKEIYFDAEPIKEDIDVLESRYEFWNMMNLIAVQNMNTHRVKMLTSL